MSLKLRTSLKGLLFVFAYVVSLCAGGVLYAQETEVLSGTYTKAPLKDIILDLEEQSGYAFFFLPDWVSKDTITVTFNEQPISLVLDQVLEGTALNHYLLEKDKRIFLLENTVIYDELPRYFFGRDSSDVPNVAVGRTRRLPPPTFFNEDIRKTQKNQEVVRVGKADATQLKQAYMLNGTAVNARTGEAIEDLAIRLKGTNLMALTDANGTFKMELPAGYNVLSIRAMGIAATEREVIMYNDGTLTFQLEEGLQQLDEVVVEAEAAKNVEDAITGSEQIDSEESKNIPLVLGERDILQVAKALPGISSAGEGATGLNVRGGKTDQNLVLLDDAVIYNPQHFFGIFQALNPFTTKGVAIYKGAVPVEFGGRLSSVFDIRTKNGSVEKIAGEGSIGPVTGNLALEIPLQKDKSSLVVGGRGAYADWILRSLDD
ncbi:carboxypeptidase-like regulatory domain-containing protein [Maribacter sp. 2307ULW6-5]|uniref:carboxypeptidase-like regulatory domain-containing protein n=1 Tax=Maribacter sp. 2307ULW6-5 TaxID=3386275 RepID=UPI0039BD59DB